MIEVSEEFKQAILSGKTNKNIIIDFEGSDFSKINFAQVKSGGTGDGNVSPEYSFPGVQIAYKDDYFGRPDNLIYGYLSYAQEISISYHIKLTALECNFQEPSYARVGAQYYRTDVQYSMYTYEIKTITDLKAGCDVTVRLNSVDSFLRMITGTGIWFLDENQNTYPSGYSGRMTFHYDVSNIQMCLGLSQSELPYDFDGMTYVQHDGLNPDNYVKLSDINIANIVTENLSKESFKLTESLCSKNVLKYGACEAAICEFDAINIGNDDLVGSYFKAFLGVEGINERLPLGRFRVGNVTKTGAHNTVTKHIEAYDGMRPLDIDVTNWYSGYMGGVNSDRNSYGIEWTRQMFSTLSNLCKNIGLNLGIKNETQIASGIYMDAEAGKIYLNEEQTDYIELMYRDQGITPGKIYRIQITNDYEEDLYEFFEETGYSYKSFGFSPKRGGIWITEYNQNTVISKFCLDDGDYFAVHPNCTKIRLEMAYRYNVRNSRDQLMQLMIDYRASLFKYDFDLFSSPNMATRLVYYNWQTREICNASSVSARNVLRSLIEITGGFLRYGRDGNLEYIQASRSGLYPSNNLYPADDLYPRQSLSSERLSMGKYISFKAEDFTTNNFGKIQIKLPATTSKDAISKTYVGSATKPNTYIIDDNVFYCADGITYDSAFNIAEPLPEVVEMMQNLYNVIMDMGYVPHVTQAFGLPWFECGDRIGLLTESGGFETFVFRRNLTGIQILRDTFEAYGEETSESIADYGIYNWK